jgi:hypothetical protein
MALRMCCRQLVHLRDRIQRGRVVAGYVKLQAPLIRAKVDRFGVRNNPSKDESDSYVVLRMRGGGGYMRS